MDSTKPDPEMLKQLEILLNLDSLYEESDWEALLNEDQNAPQEAPQEAPQNAPQNAPETEEK